MSWFSKRYQKPKPVNGTGYLHQEYRELNAQEQDQLRTMFNSTAFKQMLINIDHRQPNLGVVGYTKDQKAEVYDFFNGFHSYKRLLVNMMNAKPGVEQSTEEEMDFASPWEAELFNND